MPPRPMFTVQEAADLADMKPATVNMWIRDGLISGPNDHVGTGPADMTMLTEHTVFALAMASWLRRLGALPPVACKAGTTLAYTTASREVLEGKPRSGPKGAITSCALITEDGEATFVTMTGTITAAQMQDTAWVLPYDRIAQKVTAAAWKKRGYRVIE